jgi:DNA-binding HxlR family transcriptional regulator
MRVLAKDDCGFGTALAAIGGKWKAAILWEIVEQPVRFGQLRRQVAGISEKVLTQQLREMEADGLIRRSDLGGLVRHV